MYIKTIIQSSSLLMPYPTTREASFMQPISMAAYSSSSSSLLLTTTLSLFLTSRVELDHIIDA